LHREPRFDYIYRVGKTDNVIQLVLRLTSYGLDWSSSGKPW